MNNLARRQSNTKNSSRSSSTSSTKSFDNQYRDATPFSTTTTTTAESSEEEDEIACDDNTPTSYDLIKDLSPASHISQSQFSPPPTARQPYVYITQSSPALQALQSQESTEPTEPSAPDNVPEEFNHFRKMKKRSFWTPLELDALENGMKEFGTQWARILRMYGGDHGPLRNRNPVQLKDKARNEKLRRIKYNIELGVFYMATGGDDIITGDGDELVDD